MKYKFLRIVIPFVVLCSVAFLPINTRIVYEAEEEVEHEYTVTESTEWDVTWRTITGDRQWGAQIGKSTFPATFSYSWGYGNVYNEYRNYIGFTATCEVWSPRDGMVYFKIGSDDGSQLFVDNTKIIDNWYGGVHHTKSKSVYLSRGKHELKLRFHEIDGQASISFDCDKDILSWQQPKTKLEFVKTTKVKTVRKPIYRIIFEAIKTD